MTELKRQPLRKAWDGRHNSMPSSLSPEMTRFEEARGFPDSKAHLDGIQLWQGNKLQHTEVYSCVCQLLHLCVLCTRMALSNA